jgi:pyrimidine-nucleoside phosphorylase
MGFVQDIARKRDGGRLDAAAIGRFVTGAATEDLPPEQLAAMLMAIYLRGLDAGETAELTAAMTDSGERWALADEIPGCVDKHSTGGVGDTVSLVFAPLMVAVGRPVVMMAGRGLGHTQGTVDKLEAIPGFDLQADRREALRRVERCGAALVAQTDAIAPADRTLYALRDLTATVGCRPLIVASIMSKKLALGAARLVLDVKAGRGAFLKTVDEASALATALRDVGKRGGLACDAVVTRMDEPLAPFLGNACEVAHAVDVLEGRADGPLLDLTLELGCRALALDGVPRISGLRQLREALDSGAARRAWDVIVEAHGGDPDPSRLPRPTKVVEIAAPRDGVVQSVDGEALGWSAVDLGAGRRRREDAVDAAAGVEMLVRMGDRVVTGQPLARVMIGRHPVDEADIERRITHAVVLGDDGPETRPLVLAATGDAADGG